MLLFTTCDGLSVVRDFSLQFVLNQSYIHRHDPCLIYLCIFEARRHAGSGVCTVGSVEFTRLAFCLSGPLVKRSLACL